MSDDLIRVVVALILLFAAVGLLYLPIGRKP